ncbi:MAG: class I SAM-dependent methyltransferase [Lachnospiraceae bacterium]|nr:class I SAM-dependent methyltransferase [Lachnospiraceae bacterium]
MSVKTYGKSFGDLNSLKQNFFNNNDGMLEMADGMADIINAQPKRTRCKICNELLSDKGRIVHSHNVDYIICEKCSHLNSACEDTDDFASKVYVEDDYSKNYSMKDKENYDRRMNMIYVPKAEYLIESLKKDGVSLIRNLDIGAGCGYFVAAMHKFGIESTGIEVSENEVKHGNEMIGDGKGQYIKCVGLTDSIDYIKNTDANVVSAIGVLEHLIHLRENLDAVRDNKNIEYLYASVPMFSFSCCFETAFQQCYNRHMGGTHTHLFTNESIKTMADSIGFEVAYEWRFGSDINDLYRFISVSMRKNGNEEFADMFAEKFTPLMDQLQKTLDESEFSSELHFILRRKKDK